MDLNSCNYSREEDYVECFIYPLANNAENGDIILDKLYQDVYDLIKSLSKRYIWHRDPFNVHKRSRDSQALYFDSCQDLPSHIYGVCHFGDNIDDEWFIVYLMVEVTKKFPSLVARVVDADGELLLIEAANSLPDWATPSNCSNRMFVHKGEMLLIKPDSNEDIKEISTEEALQKIQSKRELHVASKSIQKDILNQIDSFIVNEKPIFHKTTIFTPVGVAALLKEDPSLISAAIHAFCNRDPIDTKFCKAMRYFPPENRVNTSVTFTRSHYAMLIHNNYNPDRRTGWNLSAINSPQYKSHSLGIKLACGFEILVSQAGSDSDISNIKAWKDYLQSLKKHNYFQDFLEDSKPYNELLSKAEEYFRNNLDFVKMGPKIGRRILDLLKEVDLNEQIFRDDEANLPEDDDDKWLCIDPNELESMMEERYGKKKFIPLSNDSDATEFTKKLSDFLECQSGIDGVETPNDSKDPLYSDIPVRPKRGIKKKKNCISNPVSNVQNQEMNDPSSPNKIKIDFDADQFSSAIQNILDLVIPDDSWDLESDSDMSECGSNDEIETHIHKLATSESKEEEVMRQYMELMDDELAKTDIAKSFETAGSSDGKVNVEENALKNIKQSLEEEMGGTGPAGNMLGTLGFSKYSLISSIDEEVD